MKSILKLKIKCSAKSEGELKVLLVSSAVINAAGDLLRSTNRVLSLLWGKDQRLSGHFLCCENLLCFYANCLPRFYVKSMWYITHGLCCLNPLSPKSDQDEISPNNIIALENRVVMRIEVMIREDVSNWYFNKFSPLLLLKKYRNSKWESQFSY